MSAAASVSSTSGSNTNNSIKLELYTTFIKTYIVALIPLSIFGSWLVTDQFSIWYTIYLLIWGLLFKNYWVHYKSKKILSKKYKQNISTTSSSSSVFVSENRFKFIKNVTLIPIILAILLIGQISTFCLEILITQLSVIENNYLKMALSLIPTILTTVLVKIATLIFDKTIDIRSNYIITIWSSYAPLLITLFVYLPLGYKLNYNNNLDNIFEKVKNYHANWSTITSDYKINQLRFMDQFKYFMITNQVVALGLDNLLPRVLNKDLKYIEPLNLKLGYLKYLLNFGFLVIFSNMWSLAPLISLVFVLINYYIDSYKIRKGKYVVDDDINIGQLMVIFNWLASIVQPALILMYRNSSLPNVGVSSFDKSWFTKSPVAVDKSYVLAGAFLIEHFNIGLDRVFGKLSLQKLAKEFKLENKSRNIKVETIEDEEELPVKEEKSNDKSATVGKTTGFNKNAVASEEEQHHNNVVRKSAQANVPINRGEKIQPKQKENYISSSRPAAPISIPVENSSIENPSSAGTAETPSKQSERARNGIVNGAINNNNNDDDDGDDDLSVGATLPKVIPTSSNYDLRNGLIQEPPKEKTVVPKVAPVAIPDPAPAPVPANIPKQVTKTAQEQSQIPTSIKQEPVKVKRAGSIKTTPVVSKIENEVKHKTHQHHSHPHSQTQTNVVKNNSQKAPVKTSSTLSSQAATASLNKGISGIEKNLAIPPRKSSETIMSRKSKVSSEKSKKKKKLFGIKI
ncbi:hypothetical protein ACO0SA_003596 [Hanseniaspora valbyensis]